MRDRNENCIASLFGSRGYQGVTDEAAGVLALQLLRLASPPF